MRKLILCLMMAALLAGYVSAGSVDPVFPDMLPLYEKAVSLDDDAIIRAAVQTLKSAWQKEYTTGYRETPGEYVVDIRATRLVRIKDELEEREAKYFGDISCIIEFLIYDDYLGGAGHGAGYHDMSRMFCSVAVHRGGFLEAEKVSPFSMYTSRTYNYDYSSFIEEVVDYADQYNQVLTFTVR